MLKKLNFLICSEFWTLFVMTDQGWRWRLWPWSCSGWQWVCRDQGRESYGPSSMPGRGSKATWAFEVSIDENWNKPKSGNRHMQKEKMVNNHVAMKEVLIA